MNELSQSAVALAALQQKLDSLSADVKQREFDKLSKNTQNALDDLWAELFSNTGRKNIPQKDGRWSGEPGDSIFYPSPMVIPPDKQYSNMQNKTWSQILKENHIQGIAYRDGRADFSTVQRDFVTFDWQQALGRAGIERLVQTSDRQYLHEAAFALLAKKWRLSVLETKAIKERENLVWHEEPDCTTLRLVSREVHDNLKHFGGIAMLKILINNELA